MRRLLVREFTVRVPRDAAWRHLAAVERWPSWARHIRSVTLEPAGALGPRSTGVIRLRNRVRSAFAMTAFDPPRRWTWVGKFLWLTVRYDHAFEEVGPGATRLTWTVEARGLGVSTLGRLFARIYGKNLDRAVPLLVAEMEAP